jgi:hypothetical protein
MPPIVQATCPKCKSLLRIPADWIAQPVRCRHCGQVMQARQPPPAVPPPQAARRAAAPPPLVAPAPAPVPAVPLAVPVAAPVAMPAGTATPFESLEQPAVAPLIRPRRRRSRGWWKGLAVFVGVLAIAGGVLAATWSQLRPVLFPPDEEQTAGNDKTGSPDSHPAATRPPTTARPKQPKKLPADSPRTNPARPTPDTRPRPDPVASDDPFHNGNHLPRRALVISVHNYLYANPVGFGTPGAQGRNVRNLLDALAGPGLKIPRNQIFHLSDFGGDVHARPPVKPVIEKTLASFLATSRAQDRIVVLFAGRGIEINGEPFLVPIEGELDNPATLLPLKAIYEQLAACKCRQKVLILDVSRFSPTRGLERPDGGPLGPKFEKALKQPPPGAQVWAACSGGQRSYATDDMPMGVFLESLYRACKEGIPNKIQRYEDLLPLEHIEERVNALMVQELRHAKLEQVSFLSGQDKDNGVPADRAEGPAAPPTLAAVPGNQMGERLVQAVLAEVGTPAVKPSHETEDFKVDALPPFKPEVLEKYEADGDPDSALRKAVHNARVALWAVSTARERPQELKAEINRVRTNLKNADLEVVLNTLDNGVRAPAATPAAEKNLKDTLFNSERNVARIIGLLNDSLEELRTAGEMRSAEPKRWQANYDYTLARLQEQIAFLYEFQSMLGDMRKEFPPRDPKVQNGWRLAATSKPQGDSTGKKLEKEARKLLDKIAKEHAGTPWEVLAKREKLTALGLKWQATK